ncbi:MAG: hypothetical protein SNJ74_06915 [Fimbriimonadaceae bacterium]
MRTKTILTAIAGLVGCMGMVLAVGCGKEPEMPKEEYEAKVQLNVLATQAFQRGMTTWDSLPQETKDAFIAEYKEEAKAKEMFDKTVAGLRYFMEGGRPPGSTAAPGGAPGATPAPPQ